MGLLVVLCVIVLSLASGDLAKAPESPCPQYFTYSHGPQGAPIGRLRVPVRMINLPVTLKLHLVVRVALKTKYAGLLLLSDHPTLALGNILGGRIDFVNYIVRFPVPDPLPYLREITVNNATLCAGKYIGFNSVFGGVVTNIYLRHTFPAPHYSQYEGTEDHRTLNDKQADEDPTCGTTEITYKNGKMVGYEDEKWPWLAAIFLKYDSEYNFHCVGNLISKRHIITAAHCINNQNNRNMVAENFHVYLGVKNVEYVESDGSQHRNVEKINIHPDYNVETYVADIAILTIQEATLNERIRPVCLWSNGPSLRPLIGHFGTVVGWGLGDSKPKHRSKPQVYQLPIVDHVVCLRSRKEFLYITSDRTLCAGLRNGTGPCMGDSGSGMVILTYNEKNTLGWTLRGIISLSLLDPRNETCDLNEYLVFTDVARFIKWINKVTIDD